MSHPLVQSSVDPGCNRQWDAWLPNGFYIAVRSQSHQDCHTVCMHSSIVEPIKLLASSTTSVLAFFVCLSDPPEPLAGLFLTSTRFGDLNLTRFFSETVACLASAPWAFFVVRDSASQKPACSTSTSRGLSVYPQNIFDTYLLRRVNGTVQTLRRGPPPQSGLDIVDSVVL